jgi:Protein of unknown function (DUF5131)
MPLARDWSFWVSYEPALRLVDWDGWESIKWLVSGGESGENARPSHPYWHIRARDFCVKNAIAYFFKQWGRWAPMRKGFEGRAPGHPLQPDGSFAGTMKHAVLMYPSCKKNFPALLDGEKWEQFPKL